MSKIYTSADQLIGNTPIADTDGKADIFAVGVGAGGTITGIGEYLKS